MRTTITFSDEAAAIVEQRRRETGKGVSETVSDLVREAAMVKPEPKRFVQRTSDMGPFLVDVTNVWEAIEQLEGPDHK